MRIGKIGFAVAFAIAAQGSLASEGRWEGLARLPGGPVPVVIDLAPQGDAWVGAVTLPGRGFAGARLRTIEVGADGTVRAVLPAAAGAPARSAPSVELHRGGDGHSLEGVWLQGGHSAPLSLTRRGTAQLAAAAATTALAPALAGTWRGRYDIGFGTREVTLRVVPPAASMSIVGQRTTEVSFDEVMQQGAFVVLRSSEFGITIEAPWADASRGTLAALWQQGPFEAPLLLRREGAR